MQDDLRKAYKDGMSPEQLADSVLDMCFRGEMPSLPIDPFLIMRKAGIVYQFMDFKRLEGIYIVPENEQDIAIVGINENRPITRKRFTAAHELCHHIKDRKTEACGINDRREIERYAEKFAAALLMPQRLFISHARKMISDNENYISLENALQLSIEFGVSFKSCVNRLMYRFHLLDSGNDTKRSVEKYKPDKKKQALGIDVEDIRLLKQAIDSYIFFFNISEEQFWLMYKNDFIFNENRMEGVQLERQEVAEIITDLRLNGKESEFCNEQYDDIIQVMGHSALYDYISDTSDIPTVYSLLNLNRQLFQFAPFPDEAGKTRTSNNLVLGAKFETVDYNDIVMALYELSKNFDDTLHNAEEMSNSEYIDAVARIHHRITQIHPFRDGNGRCSRALLNWMFKIKGLPPIYIHLEDKEKYYDALSIADEKGEYKELDRVLIHELFRMAIRINKQ